MKFKDGEHGRMLEEFQDKIHPQLRAFLLDFDAWSKKENLPEPVVTMLGRTIDEEVKIYLDYWTELIHRLNTGGMLTPKERLLAQDKAKKTPAILEAEAKALFSYHFCWCAADIRDRHYDQEQLSKVLEWIHDRCPSPMWMILEHDVTAPHIHVQRTDLSWRKQFDPRNKPPPKGAA